MACLAVRINEIARSRLGLILAILNWTCILASLSLLGIGLYIKFAVEEYINLVEGYDDKSLPYLLVSLGILSTAVNTFGGFVCLANADIGRRYKFKILLLPYIISALCVCVCIMAGGILCYSHISHLDNSFKNGLVSAMSRYRDDVIIKEDVDFLQMSYKCCGDEGYTDWFHTSWINQKYLDMESKDVQRKVTGGTYLNDDTPFSCCNPASPRPCIHHHVHNNEKHFNYDYKTQTTLHTMGCKEALMDFFGDTLLTDAGGLVFGIFLLQLIVPILTRYLQTSIETSVAADDPHAPSLGYLFDFGGKPSNSDTDKEILLEEGTNGSEFTDNFAPGEFTQGGPSQSFVHPPPPPPPPPPPFSSFHTTGNRRMSQATPYAGRSDSKAHHQGERRQSYATNYSGSRRQSYGPGHSEDRRPSLGIHYSEDHPH